MYKTLYKNIYTKKKNKIVPLFIDASIKLINFMKNTGVLLFFAIFLIGCATYKPQYNTSKKTKVYPQGKDLVHSFYLIGDAGNSNLGESSKALKAFKKELLKASKNSTALFLGDNVYENGIPKKSSKDYELASYRLKIQTDAVKQFEGKPVFIPGNHDWYSGLKGLNRQEKQVRKALGKNTFLPENGCPITKVRVSEDIELVIVDSQWYITNWDKHPNINDKCDIKTRNDFLSEFGNLIKKARGKTTIVAIHHPMYTNGPHGGQYSFGSHMNPLPVLGTLKNIIRKTSGLSNTDLQNVRYKELRKRLITMAQFNKKVVFVSGHEHNLQYIIEDNLHQIVSGSGSKVSAVRNIGGGQFGYGAQGYARLDVFKDGSSHIRFYSDENNLLYENEVFPPNKKRKFNTYPKNFPAFKLASIYTEEEVKATSMKKFLWGERYRKYFGKKIKAPTVNLDTLFGGLKPVRKGGGNQSKSLRLEDKNGAQYVMRALRKQALQYLQAVLFKDQYIEGQFDNTKIEKILLDAFTASHPYAPFVIGDLADAVGVFHTNPVLYYVPKQNALGYFNDEFGGELYMIEEHTSEGHSKQASFGFQNKLIGTNDVMEKIHNDEDVVIDEESYIRARLFDMLIGDWDRHYDQWRWIEFKEKGKKVFRPMPRDRDQAFSIMSDGALLSAAVRLVPAARLLRAYSDDLEDVKGVNIEPYPLDMEFIQQSEKKVWDEQVKRIQKGLTDEVIEKAFLNMPKEVLDDTVEEIKRKLKARRANLQKISDRYYALVNNFAVIKGTNKDDWFDIERLPNGKTKITAYRIQKGKKGDIFLDRIYKKEETKEIWIYGLDDKDVFHVYGNDSNNEIKLRLIGGQNNDTYNIKNGKRVTFYDFKSKENTVITKKGIKKFTDNYKRNTYDYKKLKNNTFQLTPTLGSNPDDGFKLGVATVFTNFGFERNPFTSQHKINAAYFFSTKGYELGYYGEFANIFQGLNLGVEAHYTSPNYAANFFGFGTETTNPNYLDESNYDKDYNRIKIRKLKAMPSLIWRGQLGASFKAGVFYESNQIERTEGRISSILPVNHPVFNKQNFYGVDAKYHFENKDNPAFPTLGFYLDLQTGYKNNIESNKGFGYFKPKLGFDYKLIPSGDLVLTANFRGHINIGDDFQFYQAANLGSNNGLRGYRKQRFTGKNAFVQSTDIRWNFTDLKTQLVPIQIGVYGGVDYGRVWVKNDTSNKWQNSYGGGLFINFANMLTGNISAFTGAEGTIVGFKMGFGF